MESARCDGIDPTMTRAQRACLLLSTILAAGTGLAYAWALYLVENDDPFEAYNTPIQPWLQGSHILLTPPLVFCVGWIFEDHVLEKIAGASTRRVSGLLLMLLFTAMVASGYGLLVCGARPNWHVPMVWTHGISGSLWILVYLFHAVTGRRG